MDMENEDKNKSSEEEITRSPKGVSKQQQKRKVKGVADIVFCIDVSGSMKPCIDGLVNNLDKFFDELENNPNRPVTWRARVVSFSDIDEDPPDVGLDNSRPFTDDLNLIKGQISSLVPITEKGYGGGIKESSLDAIFIAARDTEWRPSGKAHRFIVLFTDAPPKEELNESSVEENQDRSVNELTNFMRNNNINLYFWAPENDIYRELKKIRKADYNIIGTAGNEERYEGLKNQNFNNLVEQLAKTVSATTLG